MRMFLSRLDLNPRDASCRRDLQNVYDLHRTLMRAFPAIADSGPGRVLFRLDAPRDSAPTVLVQSDKEPDWGRLPRGYAANARTKSLAGLAFRAGQRLVFRLRANPAKRAGKGVTDPAVVGKRVGLLREADREAWFRRKGEAGGFRVITVRVVPEGNLVAFKGGQTLTFAAARFDGVLEVIDPSAFTRTHADGIGPAKGLGFGLLSVAPA
jgi:CRISPR system Cascade subunit CasE